jgi:phage shock protein PspC (stress-responsive transcriptional regulator)
LPTDNYQATNQISKPMRYKSINNLFGWIAFAVAAFVYCSTIEPSASYWDCPEFISSAYKLEVGHPPGAPVFMITANLFSQFAKDASHVAMMVNIMSALLSAACILFLFWTITHLSLKLIVKDGETPTLAQTIEIMGAGLVGALAYTFSDTFWFSAVEGEVYAYSSMCTALVFWLILKWENRADNAHSDRWLVLIAYLMGLSIGVHLLNLLCIPAIVLVYVYKHKPNIGAKGSLAALAVSFVVVAAVLYGVVPGITKVGGWFELFFVNTLGFKFQTGMIVYLVVLVGCVIWAIYESQRDKNRKAMAISAVLSIALLGIPFYGDGFGSVVFGIIVLAAIFFLLKRKTGKGKFLVSARVINSTLLCFLMLMIGYSSYALIVIRSTANPPMDQNSPEDIFTLGSYLNREQYGSRPLFYGQAYTSQPQYVPTSGGMLSWKCKEGKAIYNKKEKENKDEKDSYVVVGHNNEYLYAQNMLFPRMYSNERDHVAAYENWMGGVEGRQVPYDDPTGRVTSVKMPTQFENLKFFLSYQMNFMYWRYFMWNFAGRQNDIQGFGEKDHGNWITGFSFLDNARLGDQSLLPDSLKNNKGHNVFYCLPLILGLIGLFFQAYKGPKGIRQFWVVFFLFFMTGIAIVLYLNQTPNQPRERDYAYAGSFYAFAIWIGMGVLGIVEGLKKLKLSNTVAAAIASLACLLVPIQMASQTWDDHDRSGRYLCRDFGGNYLRTLPDEGNPIIFCNGDNDTFPQWYNQEVEGERLDARVCNFSYLQTDWYIDQMKRPAYKSPPCPISWNRLQYVSNGEHEMVRVDPSQKEALAELNRQNPDVNMFELSYIMKNFVLNSDPELRFIPTDSIVLTVDKDAVRKSGMWIQGADSTHGDVPDQMVISLKGRSSVFKSELMLYEMLAQTNFKRPMYIAISVGADNYGKLGDYFVKEGMANRITPYNTAKNGNTLDPEKCYNNLMFRYRYGGLKDRELYIDENAMRMCWSHRVLFAQTALKLIERQEIDKAKALIAKCEKEIPEMNVPYDWRSGAVELARAMMLTGNKKRGEYILDKVAKESEQYMTWFLSLSAGELASYRRDYSVNFEVLKNVTITYRTIKSPKEKQMENSLMHYYDLWQSKTGTPLYQGMSEEGEES